MGPLIVALVSSTDLKYVYYTSMGMGLGNGADLGPLTYPSIYSSCLAYFANRLGQVQFSIT
jgi:hypothetical protein